LKLNLAVTLACCIAIAPLSRGQSAVPNPSSVPDQHPPSAGTSSEVKSYGQITVPEIVPGFLAGYLEHSALPNSLSLVPPKPEAGSAVYKLDEAVSRSNLALRGSKRWEQAALDADLRFPGVAGTFSCAVGIPITEADTPHLYTLLRRSLTDAALSTYAAKNKYKRTRPFMENNQPTCAPDQEESLRKDGSYPSGHTTIGWTWALILTEIAPGREDAILSRGRAFGDSRLVCNVHWQSDVNEGRLMGASTVARLHADPGFEDDLEAAKTEYAVAVAKGLKPTRDCVAEAAALEIHAESVVH
jgi:acid phosphatase (class A)